jgi:hypothetical protein
LATAVESIYHIELKYQVSSSQATHHLWLQLPKHHEEEKKDQMIPSTARKCQSRTSKRYSARLYIGNKPYTYLLPLYSDKSLTQLDASGCMRIEGRALAAQILGEEGEKFRRVRERECEWSTQVRMSI